MTDKIEWGGTLGPWIVDPRYPADIQTYDGYEVASAFNKNQEGDTWVIGGTIADIDPAMQRANARAIAEVPAMVVAIQRCCDWFDIGGQPEFVLEMRAILARIDGKE